MIGAGVLSLAWSTAQLGWIVGPISMFVFAGVTFVSTSLLCDCYMYPDPEYGPNRIRSYMDAVNLYLGKHDPVVWFQSRGFNSLNILDACLNPTQTYQFMVFLLYNAICWFFGIKNIWWKHGEMHGAGEQNHKVCGIIAHEALYGTAIAYAITTASSIKYDSLLLFN